MVPRYEIKILETNKRLPASLLTMQHMSRILLHIVNNQRRIRVEDIVRALVYLGIFMSAIATGIFTASFLWNMGPEKWSCESFSQQTNLRISYDKWNGCMIHTKSGEIISKNTYEEIMKKQYTIKIN